MIGFSYQQKYTFLLGECDFNNTFSYFYHDVIFFKSKKLAAFVFLESDSLYNDRTMKKRRAVVIASLVMGSVVKSNESQVLRFGETFHCCL